MPPRTEREKMLAGEQYNLLDPDLEAERRETKALLLLFNRAESPSEQLAFIRKIVGSIGQASIIEPPFHCSYGHNTHLGDHVYLNFNCTILDNAAVRIGSHVMIGPMVQIYTAAHPIEAEIRNQGWEVARSIVIEDNVWVGGCAILLPGVTIGRNAVVGAGAVVTRNVPPDTVVAGNPARAIRSIDQE